MQIRVLGSAAGGGFPQWNCNCPNCSGVRQGSINAQMRTQSSIIVGNGSPDWALINASPDVLTQIKQTPVLQPARQMRDSGIAAVVLMDAQVDHVTGLMMLRERNSPLPIYATQQVFDDLTAGLPLVKTLSHYCTVEQRLISPEQENFSIPELTGIAFTPITLSSKAPPYSPHRHDPHPGDNIGLLMTDITSGKKAFYAPGLGVIEPQVEQAMRQADVLLVDGTFWTDDEMISMGLSSKRAIDMGHLAQSGPGGMLEELASHSTKRRILIHINNTNPILREDSPQALQLKALGIEVAFDGMHIEI
ncbi:pyrroloquinoline quinone biosynthesis protein PqqB [Alcaligenaceae bacterium LF4-65]|uniref:Coenzyme PQQ synthesis protein B n=1 Tax=Zwartia hollandica TaxID=324606 RepID=A0A953NAF8_9BURK|nr:pyrroloquinoline quinone biosynthesis protein PqqB [Zwartia hollandica]MBZ1349680.1 pyrroloquinoline quinone biosynthesis protein PqqB [Zwartia hollandica]